MYWRKDILIMTIQELITQINIESNDIFDEETEYIQYINAAIDYLSMILVNIRDREVIKTTNIRDGFVVPNDFMSFVPKNGYPIRIVNGLFKTYDGDAVQDVTYSVYKNHVTDVSDFVPFSDFFATYLTQLVSYLVKKKSMMIDYASYDKQFIDYLTGLIQNARGVS